MTFTVMDLFDAVVKGDKFVLDKILDKLCVNTQDDCGNTALITACRCNNIEMVEYLLDRGASANIQNARGDTALLYSLDNHEIIKLLINKGRAEPKIKNNLRINPLRISIIRNNLDLLKLLIRSPEDVNEKDSVGRNALLFEAVSVLRINCAIILIKSGAVDYDGSVFELFNKGINSIYVKPYLLYLLSHEDSNKLECVKRSIVKFDENIFKMQEVPSLNTFIEQSIKYEDIMCLDFIKNSFDVKFYKIRDPEGNTLLSLAAKNKNKDVVKWIYGAVLNELNNKKELIKYFIRSNNEGQIAISISFDPQYGNNTQIFNYLYEILTKEYSQGFIDYIITKFLLPIVPHRELTTLYAHWLQELVKH